MKIKTLTLDPYEIPLTQGQVRLGVLVHITNEEGEDGWGDIAPLPKWSLETLEDAIEQLQQKKEEILKIDWNMEGCLREIARLSFLPSCSFGLESALLSLLDPLSSYTVPVSALLMGSLDEILHQANLRKKEGFVFAKLKVGHLSFQEAKEAIYQLKDVFRLRVDVNCAWKTKESLDFFSKFSLDAFDYVEEPFQDPQDLRLFTHPLAVDESFPRNLSLKQLEKIPALKALIYKPTLQGGMVGCMPLLKLANKMGVDLVLSSSFESDVGLAQVASMAHRLSLKAPSGLGTYHFLQDHLSERSFVFSGSIAHVSQIIIKESIGNLNV